MTLVAEAPKDIAKINIFEITVTASKHNLLPPAPAQISSKRFLPGENKYLSKNVPKKKHIKMPGFSNPVCVTIERITRAINTGRIPKKGLLRFPKASSSL